MNSLRVIALTAALATLPGCLSGILPKAGSTAFYTLPEASAKLAEHKLPLALLIDTPRAVAPLDSADLLVIRSDGEVQIVPNARWAAPIPVLIQNAMAQAIERSRVVPAVAQSTAAYRMPLRLTGELRAFGMRESGGALVAQAAITLQLICSRDARVLSSNDTIQAETRDVAPGTAAAVASLRSLSTELTRQTILWLAQTDVSTCIEGEF